MKNFNLSIILLLLTNMAFAVSDENNMYYSIGYEIGFEEGATKIANCINPNPDKKAIVKCVQKIVDDVNKAKSLFPNTKKLTLPK